MKVKTGRKKAKTAENKRKALSSLPKVTSFFRPASETAAVAVAAAPGPSCDASQRTGTKKARTKVKIMTFLLTHLIMMMTK